MDFGNILRRAWEIIWNNKILWLFGILAACGSGGGGGGGGGNFSANASSGDLRNFPPEMQRFFSNLERSFGRIDEGEIFGLFILLFAIICVISIVAFLVSTYGRVALIEGASQANAGRKLRLGQLIGDSNPHFGKALILNFLLGIAVFLFFIVGLILVGVFGAATFGIGLLCLIPLVCLLLPLSFAYNVFTEFANNALVIEGRDVFEAMRRGWQVLRDNLGEIALMALIVLVVGFLLGIVVALPVISVIVGGAGAMFFGGSGVFENLWLLGIGFCGALLVTMVLSGILRSYLSSVWTLAFLDRTAAVKAVPARVAPKTPKKKSPAKKRPSKKSPPKKRTS